MSRRIARAHRLGGEHENYPTPAWAVHRLLDDPTVRLPFGRWLEPCAGDGAIIRAVDSYFTTRDGSCPIRWSACDIRDTRAELQAGWPETNPIKEIVIGNFLDSEVRGMLDPHAGAFAAGTSPRTFDVAATNCPYSQAEEFLDRMRELAPIVVLLLRLNYLESDERAERHRRELPSLIRVLPDRPQFAGKGTDSCAYGWMIWDETSGPSCELRVLGSTPLEVRKPDSPVVARKAKAWNRAAELVARHEVTP